MPDSGDKILPNFVNYDGFLLPQNFNFLSAIQYEVQPGDVFISTYPKCGTTWMQNIVYLIQHDGEPMPAGQLIGDHIPFLESVGKEKVEQIPAPRTIKTHLAPYTFPLKNFAKYIFIARNPKDCCVSFYFHIKGFNHYGFENGKFDDMFDIFMNGKLAFNHYFDYLMSWNSHLNDENVLFLTYEGMKKDLKSCVLKVAKFLGSEYEQKILQDESLLQKIVDESSLGNMKKMDSEKKLIDLDRPDDIPFVRKGQIGDWRNYFSEEQSRTLNEKFKERTKGTVFENMWDDVM